jgi:hypothetical protein
MEVGRGKWEMGRANGAAIGGWSGPADKVLCGFVFLSVLLGPLDGSCGWSRSGDARITVGGLYRLLLASPDIDSDRAN